MRKLIVAALSLLLSAGLLLAAPVIFQSYDKEKKELKVKDGDKEITYKLNDKTTYKAGDKDMTAEKAGELLGKLKEGKSKLEITAEKDVATEVKFIRGKAKDKN